MAHPSRHLKRRRQRAYANLLHAHETAARTVEVGFDEAARAQDFRDLMDAMGVEVMDVEVSDFVLREKATFNCVARWNKASKDRRKRELDVLANRLNNDFRSLL